LGDVIPLLLRFDEIKRGSFPLDTQPQQPLFQERFPGVSITEVIELPGEEAFADEGYSTGKILRICRPSGMPPNDRRRLMRKW